MATQPSKLPLRGREVAYRKCPVCDSPVPAKGRECKVCGTPLAARRKDPRTSTSIREIVFLVVVLCALAGAGLTAVYIAVHRFTESREAETDVAAGQIPPPYPPTAPAPGVPGPPAYPPGVESPGVEPMPGMLPPFAPPPMGPGMDPAWAPVPPPEVEPPEEPAVESVAEGDAPALP